jgi:hypothetical protein
MQPYTKAEIEKWFTHQPHTPEQGKELTLIHDAARATALLILATLTDSPEKKLALDNLQEAVLWANTSVSRSGSTAIDASQPSKP